MIISKSPLRMSYVGGGSDLPSYYRECGGAVISTAINHYVYVMVKDRFEDGVRVSYSKTENVKNRNEIEHPLVRNVLLMLDINKSVEIVSAADIPSSGTGLGSSSSFSVGLVHALSEFKGEKLSPGEIAASACELEIELCGSPIGKQDQYASAFGGLKVYKFNSDDSVSIQHVNAEEATIKKLNSQTLVFYIGGDRSANEILKLQSEELKNKDKRKEMAKMVSLVEDLRDELESQSVKNFGPILHENWKIKREMAAELTTPYIDDLYDQALNCGATGGKLLGAGGGGFMMFHVPSKEVASNIRSRFYKLREVQFDIEPSGSTISLVK
jgi:D-glycero-alpha-D-manno-heptose-7-phosphate kinase